ncbi:hypothetical protein AZE42_10298 [Rhizopogon vesiculosus]|uniref:Uncharacterized protein n=1 Tax=Rhizopogon vesiculosus TaxID=180088 RepID=A0A1J8QVW2_9AGAM|nr:hypothetical protein AZE42_10298 [Rhizopogon vesiculosus]
MFLKSSALEAPRGLILTPGGTLPVLVSEVGSANNKPVEAKQSQLPGKRKPKAQKLDTRILATFDDDRYITADEDNDTRKAVPECIPYYAKFRSLVVQPIILLVIELCGVLRAVGAT